MPADSAPVSVGFLIADAHRLMRQRFEVAAEAAGLGLTPGEARMLIYVSRKPGQRQSVIADAMSVDPMTLVGFLDSLEGLGLLTRSPDPGDRRAKIIHVTAAAAPVIEKIHAVGHAVNEDAMSDLDHDERTQLRSLLTRMIGRMCGTGPTAAPSADADSGPTRA